MNAPIHILSARHAWQEDSGFSINRPNGISDHVFLHFLTPVELLLNEKKHCLPAGSCLFYHAQTPQWFHSPGPLRHNWMHLSGDLDASLAAVGLQSDHLYTIRNSEQITSIIRQIESEVLTQPHFYQEFLQTKYQELLIAISRSVFSASPFPSLPEGRLEKLRAHLFAHLDNNWTVAEMAAYVRLSPSRFYALYKQFYHISPMDDLIRARIDTAKYCLSNSETSVHTLAESLGYHSLSHFCRQFKAVTGQTPGEYRISCLSSDCPEL